MSFYLGIDLGTTGLKAVLADEAGTIVGNAYQEYPLNLPNPGFAEQEPEGWYRAMCAAITSVLHGTGVRTDSIRCVGLSGQMHGLVMLDKQKRVLYPAIIHCDGRAAKQKQEILDKIGIQTLGNWVQNRVFSGFQALSLLWMRENEAGTYGRIYTALLPKDYLRFRLTGEIATERTDASGTLLYDVSAEHWSQEMLDELDINPSILPAADHLPSQLAGTITRAAAKDTGLDEGTPVAFGGADQTMQAVGNGLLKAGSSSVNLGTSGQVFVATDRPIYDPLLRTNTFCHALENSWYIMGAVLNASLAFNWFAHNILESRDYPALDTVAAQAAPGAGGLLFLPYLTGERSPHMNENAKAAFLGLTLSHGQAEMVRAVLEGVAFALLDALEVLRELQVPVDRMVISGGGAKSALWRQIIADVFEMPLHHTNMTEQAAMGAVLCAQVASGAYASLQEACDAVVRYDPNPTLPEPRRYEGYREAFGRYREAYLRNAPLF